MSENIVSDVVLYVNRGITPKYTDNKDQSIIVINQKCIRDYKVNLEYSRLHDSLLRKVVDDKIVRKYDVLINSTGVGTLGRVAQYLDKNCIATVDSHVTIVRPNIKEIDPIYFGYLLKNQQKIIEAMGIGSTGQTELGRDAISNIPINIIKDRKEQLFIGKTFKALDDKIENNQRMNKTLEAMAQAIFKSWFVDFEPVYAKAEVLENSGSLESANLAAMQALSGKTETELQQLKTQDPKKYNELESTAKAFPSCFISSPLGDIPQGWEVKQIDDIAQIIKGKSYKSTELKASKTALVTLKSFNRGGGYRLDGLKEYIGSYKSEQEVFAGDLIIAYTDVTQAADVIGKPAMVVSDPRYEHLVISLDVAVVKPYNKSHKYYLYGVANSIEFQQHTNSHCTGTTVLHLSKYAVPKYNFVNPDETLLKIYDSIVKSYYILINQLIAENQTLATIRDTLLPKLLSGEIKI